MAKRTTWQNARYNLAIIVGVILLVAMWLSVCFYPVIISYMQDNWWFMLLYFLEPILIFLALALSKLIIELVEIFK